MGQFDRMFRAAHESVMDGVAHQHAAHRSGAVGDALGEGQHVGHHAITFGGKGEAEPAKAGDDLVEDQEDAVLLGDLAQPLEIAFRRRQYACRSRHRLDDHGGDGVGAVQIDDAFEFIGEMRAIFGLALAEGLLVAVIGRRQMIDAGQERAEHLSVATMPPTEVPPKPTRDTRSRPIRRMRLPWPLIW